MPAPKMISRRDRLAIAAAALVASLSVSATVVLAFAGDGATAWFVGESSLAQVAHRCDQALSTAERRRCQRARAAAQRATDDAPTRLASRH